jgi:hypothetical protein
VVDGINGDGEFTLESSIIRVYDNNFPNETNRFIEITPRPDRSSYKFPRADDLDDPATRWDGRWSGQGIYAIPIDVFNREHTMPGAEELLELTYLLVVGGADAHCTDGQGGEWGWRADGSVADNLPGARSITPVGGPNSSTRNVMLVVPSTNPPPDLAINVRSNHYTFHAANGGRLFQLERRDGVSGDTDHMNMAYEDGRLAEMRYTPQQGAGDIRARVGLRPVGHQSVVFELSGLEVPAGGTAALRALPAEPGVELRNESSVAVRPVLAAQWSDGPSGQHGTNQFSLLELPPGAAQRLVIADWPVVQQLRVETDLDRDGTPDVVSTQWADAVAALAVDIEPGGLEVTLSWPLAAENRQLEAAPTLDVPGNLWSPVMPPYHTNASRISVTLPLAESSRFFRLRNLE